MRRRQFPAGKSVIEESLPDDRGITDISSDQLQKGHHHQFVRTTDPATAVETMTMRVGRYAQHPRPQQSDPEREVPGIRVEEQRLRPLAQDVAHHAPLDPSELPAHWHGSGAEKTTYPRPFLDGSNFDTHACRLRRGDYVKRTVLGQFQKHFPARFPKAGFN